MTGILNKLQASQGVKKKHSAKSRRQLGLLTPNSAFSTCVFSKISETSKAAMKWDPLTRPSPNLLSEISIQARKHKTEDMVKSHVSWSQELNESQQSAVKMVIEEHRKLTLIQGPPGTGKT